MRRDPVCGMPVAAARSLVVERQSRLLHFCSPLCMRQFLANPEAFGERRGGEGEASAEQTIAYFSMEVAADPGMPTYSGGLGVLAGDVLRAFADLRVPVVGVSLLHRKGYFRQALDPGGNQIEREEDWAPDDFARPLPARCEIVVAGKRVVLQAWGYDVRGCSGFSVPLLLLDADLPENAAEQRELTSRLYGGDADYRLAQEIVLGIGGLRMLGALGFTRVRRFHMNEGHSSLLGLELLRQMAEVEGGGPWAFQRVRERCVFTTHTPVPAGHDQFPYDQVQRLLGEPFPLELLQMLGGGDRLNMTLLAIHLSQYVNGVAKKHGEVSREMFPGHAIDAITNGVHPATWTCPSFRELYDRYIPGWSADPFTLRKAVRIPSQDLWTAHERAKQRLVELVSTRSPARLRADVFTLGFARRATQYKRMGLLFHDLGALRALAHRMGGLQIVLAGKAHPHDEPGKDLIRRVFGWGRELKGEVGVVYLENYDMELAQYLTAGVDLWLNTPLPPLEASGTSGMKAALNGVPSLSVLDGWWLEGHIEGVTGWAIGSPESPSGGDPADAAQLYRKLDGDIGPLYQQREAWIEVMRHCIALNASFFHSHRMVMQYAASAYL